jgi:hypothetical protein
MEPFLMERLNCNLPSSIASDRKRRPNPTPEARIVKKGRRSTSTKKLLTNHSFSAETHTPAETERRVCRWCSHIDRKNSKADVKCIECSVKAGEVINLCLGDGWMEWHRYSHATEQTEKTPATPRRSPRLQRNSSNDPRAIRAANRARQLDKDAGRDS